MSFIHSIPTNRFGGLFNLSNVLDNLNYFLIPYAQSKIILFIFCIIESGQETKGTQFVVGIVILSRVTSRVKYTGFYMNIRLAQLRFFNMWSYDGSNPGEKPPASGAKLE